MWEGSAYGGSYWYGGVLLPGLSRIICDVGIGAQICQSVGVESEEN